MKRINHFFLTYATDLRRIGLILPGLYAGLPELNLGLLNMFGLLTFCSTTSLVICSELLEALQYNPFSNRIFVIWFKNAMVSSLLALIFCPAVSRNSSINQMKNNDFIGLFTYSVNINNAYRKFAQLKHQFWHYKLVFQ